MTFYRCRHAKPHSGELSDDPKEVAWREFLQREGWLRAGYCYLYYPKWLRDVWEKHHWKGGKEQDEHDKHLAVGADRRAQAAGDFEKARALAKKGGLCLKRHTDAHYKLLAPGPGWTLEIYPGNQRLSRRRGSGRGRPPWVELPKHPPWTLCDVVEAAIKARTTLPPWTGRSRPRPTDPQWDHQGKCDVCGGSPVLKETGMCGVCTFGEAETAGMF